MKEITLGLNLGQRIASPLPPIPEEFWDASEIDPKWLRVRTIVDRAREKNGAAYGPYFAEAKKRKGLRWEAEAAWMALFRDLGVEFSAALQAAGRLLAMVGRSGGACNETIVDKYHAAVELTDKASSHDFLCTNERAFSIISDLYLDAVRVGEALERHSGGRGTS